MSEFMKAMGDPKFWGELGRAYVDAPKKAMKWVEELEQIPNRASGIAEERFPDSVRDASTKNAFRHSLGTGMMAQHMGGGEVGAALAQAAGYLWESPRVLDFIRDPKHRDETMHDLNANYVGARTATETANQQELIEALDFMARQSKQQAAPPPGAYGPNHRTLTRSVR